ncbi:MAG: CHAT domain-containing protein [Cyanobacteria bacterium J06631_12]
MWSRQWRRWLWTVLFIVSFWVSLACGTHPVTAAIAQSSPLVLKASTASANWQTELTKGVVAFEAGRLAEAIAHWEAALPTATQASPLTKAYLLSNLAIVYQQLGNASAAQSAIAESMGIVQAWTGRSQRYWEVAARVSNTQGQLLWQQGKTRQALTSWQQAESHYRSALQQVETRQPSESENLGLVRSQINQAIALQELGLNVRALQTLREINLASSLSSTRLQLAAAKEIGKALRRIGALTDAQAVLSDALQVAIAPSNPEANPESNPESNPEANRTAQSTNELAKQQITLELGHTLRSLSHRAITIGKVSEARAYSEQAIAYYSATAANPPTYAPSRQRYRWLQTQAQLNQLSFLIESGQIAAAGDLWPQIDLQADLNSLAPGRDRTEAHISYAHSLNCLQSPASVTCVRTEWQNADATAQENNDPESRTPENRTQENKQPAQEQLQWQAIAEVLTAAIQQAQALTDPLLESYAVGELAHTYELAKQPDDAIPLTQQALGLLEGKQAPEAAYRWEWQLGRLYNNQSQNPAFAKSAYQQALTSLDAVRQNLLLTNPQAQFSFRDDVEPLYREFVALLLKQPSAPEEQSSEGQNIGASLSLVVKTLDALQLTELENFLGCNLSQLVNLNEERIDPKAAKIYPILLPEQLAIVVDIPDQPLSLQTVSVSQATVEQTLKALRQNLTLPGKTPAVLASANQLYQWLIAPIEPLLSENEQIETLVFVSDGPLRNVPMGALYDGQQYLIEKPYAIAIAPQLSLFAPRTTSQQLQVLTGGISIPQTIRGQQFPSIELLQAELDQIPAQLTAAPPLLNESFTKANIEQQLKREQYNTIHWKTHGVFSSDPNETFLVTYQDGITANELSALVQSARVQQAEPIELLVLSACETAQGDRQAVLGLAGMAVRAGTRSALSTLWRADDRANTRLMDYFYQGLNDGLTKAQALQRSQRALLTQEGYPAPYYWASYVLVGNWL